MGRLTIGTQQSGLHAIQIVSGNALSLFQAEELELMVRGSLEPLDVQQMQLSTRYENGFERDHATIKLFWDYFRRLEPARQRKLLAFITGKPTRL